MIKRFKNIKIKEEFKKHLPAHWKMDYKVYYYLTHKKFEQPIVIDKEGYLIDGYTTWLIANKIGKKFINVKREKDV